MEKVSATAEMSKRKRSVLSELFFLMWKDRLARPAMVYIALFFALGILSFFWSGKPVALGLPEGEAEQAETAKATTTRKPKNFFTFYSFCLGTMIRIQYIKKCLPSRNILT